MKKTILSVLAAATFLSANVSAESISFDFADPKGVNNIAFNLDATLESIMGYGKGVSGRVQFDPSAPGNTTGSIELDAKSLQVSNNMMTEHLLGKNWMQVDEFPTITFTLSSMDNVETTGNITTADAKGNLTVKGVTREITARVTLTFLKGKIQARMGPRAADGDLLVLRTKFVVNRSEFNINAGNNLDKVAEEIEISMSLAGMAPY